MAIRANGISEFTRDGSKLTWTYGGNIQPTVYDCASNPDWAKMSQFTQRVYVNGAKQRIQDTGAKSDASVEEKAEAMRAVAALLTTGVYAADRVTILIEAIQRMCPENDPAEVADRVRKLPKDELGKLEKDPAVVATINKIQMERAKKAGIDAKDVLAKIRA